MTRRFRLLKLLIIFVFLVAKSKRRKYLWRYSAILNRSKRMRISNAISRSSSYSFRNVGLAFMIKRLFSVEKFFYKQSVLFFFNWRIILNVLAKISEVFHGLAFSREVSDISRSYSKIILPEFFRVSKLSIFIRASWIISLLILHHIDGLS